MTLKDLLTTFRERFQPKKGQVPDIFLEPGKFVMDKQTEWLSTEIEKMVREAIGEDEEMIFDTKTNIEENYVTYRNQLRDEIKNHLGIK